ncbi:hypothetical protein AVEN_2432-1 [Araneus ventricosus]|uniref:Uncharacterized protein n=1 Tax=Araneus ventricosus TaxID=182803 RepID=A0A4Y2IK89_ARAVE|nr:hypothetical protein AVEN_2432-1 [Araneus ventricosus]
MGDSPFKSSIILVLDVVRAVSSLGSSFILLQEGVASRSSERGCRSEMGENALATITKNCENVLKTARILSPRVERSGAARPGTAYFATTPLVVAL